MFLYSKSASDRNNNRRNLLLFAQGHHLLNVPVVRGWFLPFTFYRPKLTVSELEEHILDEGYPLVSGRTHRVQLFVRQVKGMLYVFVG